jgi:hypothetical protein
MPDPMLFAWQQGGDELRMTAIAQAATKLTEATNAAVSSASAGAVQGVVAAAIELVGAAEAALAWLEENPSPNAAFNIPLKLAWDSYLEAATMIIEMAKGPGAITPENGEVARATSAVAQRENWQATMAFVKAVGP